MEEIPWSFGLLGLTEALDFPMLFAELRRLFVRFDIPAFRLVATIEGSHVSRLVRFAQIRTSGTLVTVKSLSLDFLM